ncbi:hypothetical protein ARMSODRAFT_481302 [Armillaria solidipes]|uniref:Uncharacterized protein n=1 Tax=Armillaria solidipes TaxID=1076256 RepID=A0A2H3CCW9_9AGAR|nr:hypothetical protein ARMSODRAFT_481302 [Armillaria solidipes]
MGEGCLHSGEKDPVASRWSSSPQSPWPIYVLSRSYCCYSDRIRRCLNPTPAPKKRHEPSSSKVPAVSNRNLLD